MKDLSSIEQDALKEVANVGVGNAATALSKMIGKVVDINIPSAEFVPIPKFGEKAGGAETVVYCLHVGLDGGMGGDALFFFKKEEALKLSDLLLGKESGASKELDEMGKSALGEMSNIVVGSYISSIANMLKMEILLKPPNTAEDMLQSIVDAILIKLSRSADEMLLISTELNIGDEKIDGVFTILFDYDSLGILLAKLKEVYGV